MAEKYKWKWKTFTNRRGVGKGFTKLGGLMQGIPAIRESLTRSARSLANCLVRIEEMEHIVSNLFVYARMRRDEDNSSPKYQAMTSRATEISVRLSSALSFVSPELLGLKKSVINGYIAKAEKAGKELAKGSGGKKEKELARLTDFDFMLRELMRGKKHVLSEKEERLLSMTGDIAGAPRDIFTMLNNADMVFGNVTGADGKRVRQTHGSYIVLMQSPDRGVRERAYNALYKAYRRNINTISTAYAASVKKDIFYARAKKFDSAISRSLFSDAVTVSLFDNLIKTVHENIGVMHSYVELRKNALKLDNCTRRYLRRRW
jgi:oligoendopeptidase F